MIGVDFILKKKHATSNIHASSTGTSSMTLTNYPRIFALLILTVVIGRFLK